MTNFTHEEKQRALNEAHELMNGGADRLKVLEGYIKSALARHTTPILNEDDLMYLLEMAKRGVAE